jgi:hypothetical protein
MLYLNLLHFSHYSLKKKSYSNLILQNMSAINPVRGSTLPTVCYGGSLLKVEVSLPDVRNSWTPQRLRSLQVDKILSSDPDLFFNTSLLIDSDSTLTQHTILGTLVEAWR